MFGTNLIFFSLKRISVVRIDTKINQLLGIFIYIPQKMNDNHHGGGMRISMDAIWAEFMTRRLGLDLS